MSKGQQKSFVVAGDAYAKIVMHINKYPYLAVNGVLLGSKSNGDAAIRIVDYIPFFHGATLAPMLEAAMMLVEERATEQQLSIVGYFHANELADDTELSPLAISIGSKISKQFAGACVLLGYLREGEGWHDKSKNFSLDEAYDTAQLASLAKDCQRLQDFDNHLEDASNDFFNLRLFEQPEPKKRK
ncbi:uncharacterized protein ACA1_289700 [Acanthamoeba castellanii str. Neff]|uniref:MPN domain-containing protein n=1 Tax=Acanthamoeba castellanii (strain ATCC 30010 / Neff) TaxID=1257118 RepID=L8HJ23_ACACF|nr:uncharacterized protein ACA1_289700 [Acanthamoeba castellanii str. Neff]ELR25217.1 hypothetical protein ACA1_289700 [Acanthamoeba castellanii str. Neff]